MRIIDRINNRGEGAAPFFSFEYFPPKTDAGVENLYERLDRMGELGPLFIDVTWGAGGSTASLTMEICKTTQRDFGLETNMHLTCTNVTKDQIEKALIEARENGIQNILALRGDPPLGQEKWTKVDHGFEHASDLVSFIREHHADHFGVSVAGYPEGHTECTSYESDLDYLETKVKNGADMIITQLFYDENLFIKYVHDCRARGVTVPVLPGIMPIQTYNGFIRMTKFCKTIVPQAVLDALEPIKDNDEAVKEYGIHLAVTMCRNILNAKVSPGLHFYTLNLEKSVTAILKELGLVSRPPERCLPWKQSENADRGRSEDVRPIFWSNRPRSYLARTMAWDEYPNGRWGDSRSAAWGELSSHHLMGFHRAGDHKSEVPWNVEVQSVDDVKAMFVKYVRGEIGSLPWGDSPLALESGRIKSALESLNSRGFLTINSQPPVNGERSDNIDVGWGGQGGYVYQKAYVEFFCSPEHAESLLRMVDIHFPSLSVQAVNRSGDVKSQSKGVNAVTWGVFPGKEIVQPTVVDHSAFLVWKDEAFALFTTRWQSIYEPGTPSYKVIDEIVSTWYLVNVVENDYVRGDIFKLFESV